MNSNSIPCPVKLCVEKLTPTNVLFHMKEHSKPKMDLALATIMAKLAKKKMFTFIDELKIEIETGVVKD